MDANQEQAKFDKAVRRLVYDHTMSEGSPPTSAETAMALSSTPLEIQASFKRLGDKSILVLQKDSGEILMANPFSAVPTSFLVQAGARAYFANCIWDAMGIPAMLNRDAVIKASCADCGTAMNLEIKNSALKQAVGIAHFAVSRAHWWTDIVFN